MLTKRASVKSIVIYLDDGVLFMGYIMIEKCYYVGLFGTFPPITLEHASAMKISIIIF